ncbi:MAG: magnesium/cobalt transporter CorA [Phycisphaerae bacterium]|nr:magnesium/cobalt transporter CorA [Phycisphaerae bacterium]
MSKRIPYSGAGRLADVFIYDEQGAEERHGVALSEFPALVSSGRRVWADIEAADRAAVVPELATLLNLNPISVDVLLTRDHRPSVDEFSTYAHVIVELVHVQDMLEFEKVDVLVGPNWIITVQGRPGDCFGDVRKRLRESSGFRSLTVPYLLHALCESAARDYHRVLGRFGHRLEQLELKLITRPVPAMIHRIHAAKRDLRGFRRAVVPLRESIETLFFSNKRWVATNIAATSELPLALREIHDELGGVLDVLDAYRDATQNLSDLYLNSLSNRVNDVLRVLTIISTIFIPLSFVAGVYGMNFENMPELKTRWGYPAALGLMATMAGGLLIYFWRKGWLRKSDVPKVPSITRATSFSDEPSKRP